LNEAKDFCADAQALESLMKQRNLKMKIIAVTVGLGGGGVIGVPIIMCCI